MNKKTVIFLSSFFLNLQMAFIVCAEPFPYYKEEVLPVIQNEIFAGNFKEVIIKLKRIITDKDLDNEEKIFLLEKSSDFCRNRAYFKEAGEILELSYIIMDLEKDLRIKIYEELIRYYTEMRSWKKCIDTHFYYLQNVKAHEDEKIAVLFDIVKNYQLLMKYKKAEHVLGEIIGMCRNDHDFAYVYYYQALGCVSLNEYQKAARLFEKALNLKELTEKEQGIALYRLAFCYEILQNKEKAVECYEKALPLYDNPEAIKARLTKLCSK